MFKGSFISLGILIILCLFSYDVYAQYTVTGGTGTPYLAAQDSNNDIDVYLVYGMNNVQITYASTSDSHQWYRYKAKALEAEPLTAQQNGTTSVLSGIEEGYGYFVKSTTGFTKYVWIIDYSQYEVQLNSLGVSESLTDCDRVKLEGEATITPMYYYTPTGNKTELKRTFELTYHTQVLNDAGYLESTTITTEVVGDPFSQFIKPAPYADTDFTLTGDRFAKHFQVEKTITSDLFTATALLVKVDTVYINDPKILDDGQFSAPLEIRFTAQANEPVANTYAWNIYNKTDSTKASYSYRGNEIEHRFDLEGTYGVELSVLDRTGTCEDVSERYEINISEFYWEVPNTFSPGTSPGVNDVFKIKYRSIVSFKGWIFNRWGNQIFHWTNPDLGWDGKKGGKYVAPGVYFYVLEAKASDGKMKKKTGSINILRPKTERNEVVQ